MKKSGTKLLQKNNIKSSFEKCGIMPCNRGVYPGTRFHGNLFNRYETWVENGKEIYLLSSLMNYLT